MIIDFEHVIPWNYEEWKTSHISDSDHYGNDVDDAEDKNNGIFLFSLGLSISFFFVHALTNMSIVGKLSYVSFRLIFFCSWTRLTITGDNLAN